MTGNGDPKKDLVQDPSGFSLYRETLPDGTKRITPVPSSSNYVKLSDKGYYPGIPLLLAAAEVVADDPNKDPLDAIDEVVEKAGAGVLGDYARIPESERKAANQRTRDALNKFAKTALATTVGPVSDIYSAPQRYLVNPILSGLTGKKANYNPLGFTKSMLDDAGYADDPGEGFQTPSEALGIENPYGAFAVDAATDPSTLLGLGSLVRRGLRKGLMKARKVPNQALLDKYVKEGNYILDTIKNKSKIKTGVSKAPIDVKHGTEASNITADDIKLFEDFPTRGARPGPKGRKGLRRAGGFYTARGNRGSTFMGTDSKTHQIGLTIPEGSRYIDLSATGIDTDNLPIGDLQKLYQEGYDYIIGRNMTGGEEIIPLNPEILKSFKYNYVSGGKIKLLKVGKPSQKYKTLKYSNGGKTDGDPKKPPKGYKYNEAGNLVPVDFQEFHNEGDIDMDAMRRGISAIESASGVLMLNPYSTATGLYGQLFSEIEGLPELKDISREQFSKDKDLQEKIFMMRFLGEIPGVPGLEKNAYDLTKEYATQLGDKFNFTLDEVAALSNFLGRGGAREYFKSLIDGTTYTPPAGNKSVEEYLKKYREGRDKVPNLLYGGRIRPIKRRPTNFRLIKK